MLLALLLLGQLLLPAENARVLSTGGNLTLTWPGEATKEYVLQVTLQGKLLFTGAVKGTQAHLDGMPAGLYRWKVDPLPGYHSFQLVTERYFRFDGKDATRLGARGGTGASVTVDLQPGVPYLTLTVNRQVYLMTPDSSVVVSARGGRGGDGTPEGPPGPVPLDAGGTVIWLPGGAGRPAGPGGPGGAGGRVVVTGAEAGRYVQVHNEGGEGGSPGGAAGPRGETVYR